MQESDRATDGPLASGTGHPPVTKQTTPSAIHCPILRCNRNQQNICRLASFFLDAWSTSFSSCSAVSVGSPSVRESFSPKPALGQKAGSVRPVFVCRSTYVITTQRPQRVSRRSCIRKLLFSRHQHFMFGVQPAVSYTATAELLAAG